MKVRKLIWLLFVMALAIGATVLFNYRFPKYGNSADEICNLASRNDIVNQLIKGTDLKMFKMEDFGEFRVAVMRPIDSEDNTFAYMYFKLNDSGNYEQRGSICWAKKNECQKLNLTIDGKMTDIVMYVDPSVVLIQGLNNAGVVVDGAKPGGEYNYIVPIEVYGTDILYQCITQNNTKLMQKR